MDSKVPARMGICDIVYQEGRLLSFLKWEDKHGKFQSYSILFDCMLPILPWVHGTIFYTAAMVSPNFWLVGWLVFSTLTSSVGRLLWMMQRNLRKKRRKVPTWSRQIVAPLDWSDLSSFGEDTWIGRWRERWSKAREKQKQRRRGTSGLI